MLPSKGHPQFLSCLSLRSTCEQEQEVCASSFLSLIINNAVESNGGVHVCVRAQP